MKAYPNQLRVLFYDLETSHNVVAAFQLWEKHGSGIPFENILEERHIICAAWKWLGERTVHVAATYNGNDKKVVETLSAAIQATDVIVGHNADEFDAKYLATRLLVHGCPPAAPVQSIDTLKVARRKFLFNSNRLDYLGQFLGVGRKMQTPRGLWLKVLKHDHKAIDQMVSYCKGDVRLLERIYLKLRPYMPDHINRQLLVGGEGCPRCGSRHVTKQGMRRALTRSYQQYKCQACNGWFRDVRAEPGSTTHRVL